MGQQGRVIIAGTGNVKLLLVINVAGEFRRDRVMSNA